MVGVIVFGYFVGRVGVLGLGWCIGEVFVVRIEGFFLVGFVG